MLFVSLVSFVSLLADLEGTGDYERDAIDIGENVSDFAIEFFGNG